MFELRPGPARRVLLFTLPATFQLLVWWMGWFPGFLSPDSIDQLEQVERYAFTNFHPAFHTFVMWALMRLWETPGVVTLTQVLVLGGLLGLVAVRLVRVGAPVWAAVTTVWLVALLPAVGPTAVSVWKDVAFALALLWVFAELLVLAGQGAAFWRGWGPVRLGLGLALAWLFRHNGFLTVVLLGLILAVAYRRQWRGLTVAGAVLLGSLVVVQAVLFRLIPVEPATIEPAQVFTSDVGAVVAHQPESLTPTERAYLERIAPLEVWREAYDCYDSTTLAFHPQMRTEVLRDDPEGFRNLFLRSLLREPGTVLGHRACAASYLFWPSQPPDAYFHRPPFSIPENELGIEREPLSWRAHFLTRAVYVWAEEPGRLWLTWRPALALWLAVGIYGYLVWRRRWSLLWPGALLAVHTLNVAVTSPAQEFRFAFPLYLMSLLSLPLLWVHDQSGTNPADRYSSLPPAPSPDSIESGSARRPASSAEPGLE